MASDFRPPKHLDIHAKGNLGEVFRRWEQSYQIYLRASGLGSKPKAQRLAILLNLAGEDAIEVYNHFKYLPEEDADDPAIILKKFEEFCSPKSNVVYERHRFWSVDISQYDSIDFFVSELRTRAKTCHFGEGEDDMIRDKIVFSLQDTRVKERLLREDNLTLSKSLVIIRAAEECRMQARTMGMVPNSVHGVQRQPAVSQSARRSDQLRSPAHTHSRSVGNSRSGLSATAVSNTPLRTCLFCGRQHVLRKEKCPAYGKHCVICDELNHFACSSKCPGRVRAEARVRCVNPSSVDAVQQVRTPDAAESDLADPDAGWVGAVEKVNDGDVSALMNAGTHSVRFQLDSGATVNLLPQMYVQTYEPTSRTLKM